MRYIYNPIRTYKYDILQITPDSRLNKTVYEGIVNAIYSTYSDFIKRIYRASDGNISYHCQQPISYEIVFDGEKRKETPSFYFAIPQYCSEYLKQRIQGILPNSTLQFVDDYSYHFKNVYTYQYSYEKDSILSLNTKDNNFLETLLNIKNNLLKDEKVLFQIQMLPLSNMWKGFNEDKWQQIRNGKDVTKKDGLLIKIFSIVDTIVQDLFYLFDEILEYRDTTQKDLEKKEKKILSTSFSTASKTKINYDGFGVQVQSYIKCENEQKALAYGKSIEVALREFEEDNRLCIGKMKFGDLKRKYDIVKSLSMMRNIMSSKELINLINLPTGTLQRRFKIKNIRMKQVAAPKECLQGDICIGTMELHGEKKNVYLPNDANSFSRPHLIYAGMGAGKSMLLLNMVINAIDSGIGVIMFDYVKNCEVARTLAKMRPQVKVINLAEDDIPLYAGFPERPILDTDTPNERLNKANAISYEMKYLLNSMAEDSEPLTRKMSKYLQSATRLVFCHKGATIQNVIDVLEIYDVRKHYIDMAISDGLMKETDRDIINMRELDTNKEGTDEKKVGGILDRFSVIMDDRIWQRILSKECDYSTSFVDIMDKGESVVFLMPEDEGFSNKIIKGIFTTYLYSRVMLAMTMRKEHDKKTLITFDELHQIPQTQSLIIDKIAEIRKFGLGLVVTCHYLEQLTKEMQRAVMNVNSNHILLAGVGENCVKNMKHMFGNEFEEEDVYGLERFTSFNIINVTNIRHQFVSKLPDKIKEFKP